MQGGRAWSKGKYRGLCLNTAVNVGHRRDGNEGDFDRLPGLWGVTTTLIDCC